MHVATCYLNNIPENDIRRHQSDDYPSHVFKDNSYYFEKRPPFFGGKCPPKWRILWHDVFGNTFSGIYAPQNLYIESTLNGLHLLVSEIDRNTLEMAAIL